MSRSTHRWLALLAFAAPVALAGCKRESAAPPPPARPPAAQAPAPETMRKPFRVTGVQVGNAIGADRRVREPKATLAPGDTIYASVASEGTAEAVQLTARWTYEGGQLVSESTQTLAPEGPAVSEFHVSKPDGWPAGSYEVEILANGAPAASQQFQVR